MAKKVFLDVTWKQHSLFRDLLSYPPDGYEFVSGGTLRPVLEFVGRASLAHQLKLHLVDPLVPANLLKSFADRFLTRRPRDAVLTYASQHVVFRPEPWVVDVELVHALAGGGLWGFGAYKGLIERALTSSNCKRIITWTEAGKRTVLDNLDAASLSDKIEIIYLARHANAHFSKVYNDSNKVKLLFVNSANIPGQFEIKGGQEVLEVFRNLRKKYNNVELVLRSQVPQAVKQRSANLEGLRIIDQTVPWEMLEQEFMSADIFLFPSHITPGMAILDAMSYELPVVTIDAYANSELVQDGETGFVVAKSDRIPYDEFYFHLSCRGQFRQAIGKIDDTVVQRLVDRMGFLIENPDLRRQMGRAGRWEVEHGKFSIEKRNEKLKRILDEATAAQ